MLILCSGLLILCWDFGFVDSVFGISKVEMGFVDCGGRPVKKQRKTKRKKRGISVFLLLQR